MVQESLILEAFNGPTHTVPVWFMRQAGRYLPQYQLIREKYPLAEMFRTPALAAEITCQPVDILKVDAAILFADILTLPAAMGVNIKFDNHKGPVIEPVRNLAALHDLEEISLLEQTIRIVNEKLPSHVPLIGFAGGPFTVLTYLIEGGSSFNHLKTLALIYENPTLYHALMEKITRNTIDYLNRQKQAGINLFQLFDTWAGILRPSDYARLILPYVNKIFAEIDLPSIYYVKNTAHLLSLMDQTDADFLSVDHTVVLGHHLAIEKTTKGIQGNLFNGLLYADDQTLKREVRDVLLGGCKHGKYIFNLSHGVLPDVSPDKLKRIVEWVHAYHPHG